MKKKLMFLVPIFTLAALATAGLTIAQEGADSQDAHQRHEKTFTVDVAIDGSGAVLEQRESEPTCGASVPTKLRLPHPKIDSLLTQSASNATQLTARPSLATVPLEATKGHSAAEYMKLPLSFEPNQGQTNRPVKFLSRGSGYTLYLTSDETLLSLRRPSAGGLKNRLPPLYKTKMDDPAPTLLRMKLVGANPAPIVSGIEELPGKSNYVIGNNRKTWQRNVSTFAKVKYKNVYPGVDLVYHGNQRQLEYDFVVAPGADLLLQAPT